MFALALFSLAPATVGAPPVMSDENREIVVIGQKLKNWRGVFKQRKGNYICTTKRSTGDKMIDQIGCDALLKCATPRGPEINAIFSANKDKKAREQLTKPINDSIGECLFETRNDGIAALAEKRAAGVSK
jgi:hypothetical protein